MSRIFLSHSSANNAQAIVLRDWLIGQGWDELFLDLDPQRGLKAGERWQAALKQAAERCELVIVLVSPVWAASRWCLAEFLLATNLNKRIFGVIVEPTPLTDLPTELTAEWQWVDLTAGAPAPAQPGAVSFGADGLNRLRIGLMQTGLDPRYFAWPPAHDPERAPFRGLLPLDADDADIFFGRDGPIVLALDPLRGLRDGPAPRLLVIRASVDIAHHPTVQQEVQLGHARRWLRYLSGFSGSRPLIAGSARHTASGCRREDRMRDTS